MSGRLFPVRCGDGPSGLSQVDVWGGDELLARSGQRRAWELISDAERQQAAHFRFERDRNLYLKAHLGLRLLLSRYTGVAPECLSFSKNQWGKPKCNEALDLHFNMSHSFPVVLWAFCRTAQVGIDVEPLRPFPDTMAFAEATFSVREVVALKKLAAEDRDVALIRCWTRKEALVKAIGIGLSASLRDFTVGLGPRAELLHWEGTGVWDTTWTLRHLEPRDGFVGCLAFPIDQAEVREFEIRELSEWG